MRATTIIFALVAVLFIAVSVHASGLKKKCLAHSGSKTIHGQCLKTCSGHPNLVRSHSVVKFHQCNEHHVCCVPKHHAPPAHGTTGGGSTTPGLNPSGKNGLWPNPSGVASQNPNMAAAPPAGAQGAYDDAFNQEMLTAHNQYRTARGIPALVINPWLAEQASLQAANGFFHQNCDGIICGQNLCDGYATGTDCVTAWYDEGQSVGDSCPKISQANFESIGHYTQMIWKASKEVGCAWNQGNGVMACNYNPVGNLLGEAPC